MPSTELTTQEENFIDNLLENGGIISKAAEDAGYHPMYGYRLRKRLTKFIVEAAEEDLALNAIKASRRIVESIDDPMPHPVRLQAAQALLDRIGIVKKDNVPQVAIKANIFILPEKREIVIENE